MNKAIPVVAIVLLALVAALLIWKFSQSTPVSPPVGNGSNITDVEFKSEDFIPAFDSNGDGHVTLDEFKQRYGKPLAEGEAPFVLYHPQTKKALTAEEAFKKHWDRNSDGVIDARDMELGKDNAWLAFFKKASDAGLTPVRIGDNFYALNEDQNRTMEAEAGAKARKEVPFAGHFWDAKYFQSWAKVYDPKAGEIEGFVSEANGRLYLLSSDAALTVKDPAKVTVEKVEDAVQMKYAKAVIGLDWEDADTNLALANQCVDWGMRTEAGMLYARVLVTQPGNETALNALGRKRDGDTCVKKED